MVKEAQKLLESYNILLKIANGINPIDDSHINEQSFLHDPQVIRPLFYLADYISKEIEKKNTPHKKPTEFLLTKAQFEEIILPPGKIGVSDFAKAVNRVIDSTISKKLNGATINKKLKELGILAEEVDEEGHHRTVTNDKSEGYGIESVTRNFNGREYQKVVFNDLGKEFLLKKIQQLMG